eukprot:9156044-Alexandrium_andersonii.AAC.1
MPPQRTRTSSAKAFAKAIVARGRKELPSLTGVAASSEPSCERLSGQVVSIEKSVWLRGARP